MGCLAASRPDLVVLDLMMPVLDGWSVLDWLHARPDPPPVVVLTVRDDREAFARAVRKGAVAYLTKPFRFGDVLTTCRRVLQLHSRPQVPVAQERRREPRRLLLAAVTVYSRARHPMALGELVEISAGGVRVELGASLATGSMVFVGFHGRGLSITLEGRVQWQQPAQGHRVAHGLAFLHLSADQEKLVADLLALPAPS
jgi:CheY-like chemotaxis protein